MDSAEYQKIGKYKLYGKFWEMILDEKIPCYKFMGTFIDCFFGDELDPDPDEVKSSYAFALLEYGPYECNSPDCCAKAQS
jgi:hypothetical protein